MRYFIALITVFSSLLFTPVFAGDEGTPLITHFQKASLHASSECWDIAQDKFGFVYFANNDGLLRFNGVKWELICRVPNFSIVRSVAVSRDKIFVGAEDEFGYVSYDGSGKAFYTSLSATLKSAPVGLVWSIIIQGEKVFFQSTESLFEYSNGQCSVVKSEQGFYRAFSVNNELWIFNQKTGLSKYNNGKLEFVSGSEIFSGMKIRSVLSYGNDSLLLCTKTNGLYVYHKGIFKALLIPLNDLVLSSQITNVVKSAKGFVFGTIQNGLIFTDAQLEIQKVIDSKSGLLNNSSLDLMIDPAENIWVAQESGLSYLEINSGFSLLSQAQNLFGTVYTSVIYKNRLYAGTNNNLVFSEELGKGKPFLFSPLSEIKSLVYDLQVFNGMLFICSHDGLYVWDGSQLKQIYNKGTYSIVAVKNTADLFLAGTYSGMVAVEYKNNAYQFRNHIGDFYKAAGFFIPDGESIWACGTTEGLYKLETDSNFRNLKSTQKFGAAQGLLSTYKLGVFKAFDQIICTTLKGLYYYNSAKNCFLPWDKIQGLPEGEYIEHIYTNAENEILLLGEKHIYQLKLLQDGTYSASLSPLMHFQNFITNGFHTLYQNSENYFIGLENGLAIYSKHNDQVWPEFKAYVTNVTINNTDPVYSLYANLKAMHQEFPADQNTFSFEFASSGQVAIEKVEFSYYLEGFRSQWLEWQGSANTAFTNLSPGNYVLHVKARNIYGHISQEAVYTFTISKPWYLSVFAFVIYGIVFLFIGWFLFSFAKKRADKKYRAQLQSKENELIKMKNTQLEQELSAKSTELSSTTINLIHKNETLIKLKNSLLSALPEPEDKNRTAISRIINQVNREIIANKDEKQFELHFNQVHNNFLVKLKSLYPDLTSRDLKLCAYLRLNLDTKETATIIGVSVRTIESMRYRLRKKMNLDPETNLNEFMLGIN